MRQELKDMDKRMSDAVAALKEKFKTLRTGRANLGLLDGILVSAYGAEPGPAGQSGQLPKE